MSPLFGSSEEGQAAVARLVERYARNRDRYRAASYNEESLRNEFINPFFEALGWDITNKFDAAEQYKDVVHEETIRIGDATKAPDYTFRFGGTRKFFVEAKRPSSNLKDDPAHAYQLRRYAWSARLPVSVLTDFEELAIYDARVRPRPSDKPAVARILHVTWDRLLERFEEIWNILSKEAVHKGSFDRFTENTRTARGTSPVDTEFLKEIEGWRETLARNIALRNADLTVEELNFAVQAIIDRIVFLRIAEARGVETYGRLLALVNGAHTYLRLVDLWKSADQRYNSGLFDFSADKLTTGLAVDDKAVRPILEGLYYPKSPYEFSVLPVEILGNVYEQFLGKVIRLTPGHRAVVEDKPEIKKQGGVVYTPEDIVREIVVRTLGRLCAGRSPREMARIRVLDPACGSGSFLLAAYQHLLQRHLDWYTSQQPEKQRRRVYYGRTGWRLTTAEKKRILLHSIFGVDVDRQAVEVSKLSLLLQVLEGETEETIGQSLQLFRERALPNLDENIKCGNSLLGPRDLFPDPQALARLQPFDWQRGFPSVFREGGFDVVVGNPPYVRIQALADPAATEVYRRCYAAATKGNYDVYVLFVERSLTLLKPRGSLGFIVPHKFFNSNYGEGLRRLLADGRHVHEVVHFGDQQVFAGRSTYTCLLFLGRAASAELQVTRVADLRAWRERRSGEVGTLPAADLGAGDWTFVVGARRPLFEKLARMPVRLRDVAKRISQGCITSADPVFLFKEHRRQSGGTITVYSKALASQVEIESHVLKPVVRSGPGGVDRFRAMPEALVLFPYDVHDGRARLLTPRELRDRAPRAWRYLESQRKALEERERRAFRDAEWYRFGRSQNLGMWEEPKLMIPYMVRRLACYADLEGGLYFINVTTGGYGITIESDANGRPRLEPLYVCALLNSAVLNFQLRQISSSFQGGYFPANKQFVEQLPIRVVDSGDKAALGWQDRLVEIASVMQPRLAKLEACRTPAERDRLRRETAALDMELEHLVALLYGLTDAETETALSSVQSRTEGTSGGAGDFDPDGNANSKADSIMSGGDEPPPD